MTKAFCKNMKEVDRKYKTFSSNISEVENSEYMSKNSANI